MSKAKTLASTVSTGGPLADGTVSAAEVSGLAAVATSGAYADLSGKPSLATVATSGSYNDLSDKPTTIATANDLSGGAAGSIPYQAGTGDTAMLAPGAAGYFLSAAGPGQPPAWVPPPAGGPNGITTTSPMSANITLTALSNQVQNVAPNADSLSVYLPDATTVTTPSGPMFIIRNTGTVIGAGASVYSYPVSVRRSDNSLVTVVNPGGEAAISLVSNATARGEWSANGRGLSRARFNGYFNFGGTGIVPPLDLSNGNFIVPLQEGIMYVTRNGYANNYTLSGTYVLGLVEIDSTHALILSTNNSTLYAYYVTIGDTSLTVGASTTFAMSPGISTDGYVSLAKLDASTYVVSWAGTTTIEGVVMTLSGSTRTFGTQQALKTGLVGTQFMTCQSLVTYSATQILAAFGTGSASPFTTVAFAMTVSGTTITAGASVTVGSNTGYTADEMFCHMQNGSAVIICRGPTSSTARAIACTISGTTITAGTAVQVGARLQSPLRKWTFSASTALYYPFDYRYKNQYCCFSVSVRTITSIYNSNTAAYSDSNLGTLRDTAQNRLIGAGNLPSYLASQGRASNDNSLYGITFTSTGAVSSSPLVEAGDMTGFVNSTGVALAIIGGTTSGMMFANTEIEQRCSIFNACNFDGVWSGVFGVSYNPLSINIGANNISAYGSMPISDGLTIVRVAPGAGSVMEMAT